MSRSKDDLIHASSEREAHIQLPLTNLGNDVFFTYGLSHVCLIAPVFKQHKKDFDKLYAKRAFVHWYHGAGHPNFTGSCYEIEEIIQNYQDLQTMASMNENEETE